MLICDKCGKEDDREQDPLNVKFHHPRIGDKVYDLCHKCHGAYDRIHHNVQQRFKHQLERELEDWIGRKK